MTLILHGGWTSETTHVKYEVYIQVMALEKIKTGHHLHTTNHSILGHKTLLIILEKEHWNIVMGYKIEVVV